MRDGVFDEPVPKALKALVDRDLRLPVENPSRLGLVEPMRHGELPSSKVRQRGFVAGPQPSDNSAGESSEGGGN